MWPHGPVPHRPAPTARLRFVNSSAGPVVEFRQVSFRLADGEAILSDLDFEIRESEILVLLGRSGSGKTTTLKLVNRLLLPTQGEVRVEGRSTADWNATRLRRRIGYVIQEVGLFPHFTVAHNIGLVPRLEEWDDRRIRDRVSELLRLVGLDPSTFSERYPNELSGGQRQRVGVARALAADPPLLLLDEPFGALDPLTRVELQDELKRLHSRLRKTMVFVTHDVREALFLATRIGLLESGRLVFLGRPDEFLRAEHPEARAFAEVLKAPDPTANTISEGE